MELGEPDESGRRRPQPIEGSEFVIDADTVIMSIGTIPNDLVTGTTKNLKLTRWKTIETVDNSETKTSKEGVFAGGDIVTGAATVILAMGAGKKAAHEIDEYIKGKN
jgi:glutamate synthase (NADPH/NADH) small chain